MTKRCEHINPGQTFHTCGSYAFNLRREGIDQGEFCDVHYWQARAEKAEAVAAREREATGKLRAFAQAILKDQPDCNDLDMGVKHGLLVGTMKKEPCQEEGCNCASKGDFPMLCFTKTSLLTGVDHG